jgi:hypothetical protein
MITVKAFKYNSPNHFINKDLIDVATFTGNLKEETSVLDPVFEVETPLDLSQMNYIWIGELHRYYYVTNIVSVATNLWRIYCHVDVLMTYKPQILAHDAVIARQEGLYNLYLNDGSTFVVTQKSKIVQKKFPSGFTGSSYVMLTSGGTGYNPPSETNSETANSSAEEVMESE